MTIEFRCKSESCFVSFFESNLKSQLTRSAPILSKLTAPKFNEFKQESKEREQNVIIVVKVSSPDKCKQIRDIDRCKYLLKFQSLNKGKSKPIYEHLNFWMAVFLPNLSRVNKPIFTPLLQQFVAFLSTTFWIIQFHTNTPKWQRAKASAEAIH